MYLDARMYTSKLCAHFQLLSSSILALLTVYWKVINYLKH